MLSEGWSHLFSASHGQWIGIVTAATGRAPGSLGPDALAMLFDIGRKTQRMVAAKTLGQFRVALFQRIDDRQVILDGLACAVVTADRDLPDAADMKEDILGHFLQDLRAGHLDERLV